MENISLDMTIEIWSFTINGIFFEAHLNTLEQRVITAIYKEDKTEVSDQQREIINTWVLTIDNI